MNKLIIIGNLTADPEMYHSVSGKKFARFTVAVTRPFDREKTDFFRCVCFGKMADNLVLYQKKGNKIAVEGEVHIDSNDGKYYTSVLANNIEYLTPKSGGYGVNDSDNISTFNIGDDFNTNSSEFSSSIDEYSTSFPNITEDDLPF